MIPVKPVKLVFSSRRSRVSSFFWKLGVSLASTSATFCQMSTALGRSVKLLWRQDRVSPTRGFPPIMLR